MSCCGQHRDAMRVQVTGTAAPNQITVATGASQHRASVDSAGGSAQSNTAWASLGGGVALQYRERKRMQVRGPITGRTYLFEPTQPTVIDTRDADVLLCSRQFLRSAAPRR